MIKSSEYIILLSKMKEISNELEFTEYQINTFDKLRLLFNKYIKAASYHYWYPKVDIEKEIKPFGLDLISFCKEHDIKYKFNEFTKENHNNGTYVTFYYKNVEITPIIDLMPGFKKFKYN